MKFTIRDLFLVTMIVALAVGWWADRSSLRGELDRQRAREGEHFDAMQSALVKEVEAMMKEQNEDYFRGQGAIGLEPAQKKPKKSAPAPNPPKP